MSELTRVSLLQLDKDAGEVEMLGEDKKPKWVTVKHVDGIGYETLLKMQGADRNDPKNIALLYETAHRCCRNATRAEIDALNAQQVGAILALASGSVETVKKFAEDVAAKNGNGPARQNGKTARRTHKA